MIVSDELVAAALNATTEELPEGVQYALLRGLHVMGWSLPDGGTWDVMRAALAAVLPAIQAEERERCAKVADAKADWYRAEYIRITDKGSEPPRVLEISWNASMSIATAIRAMGEKP